MDDLKLFCKNTMKIERTRKLIARFSKDIKMNFGLDKCAIVRNSAHCQRKTHRLATSQIYPTAIKRR